MRKVVDFTMAEPEALPDHVRRKLRLEDAIDRELWEQCTQLLDLQQAQYQRQKDEQRWDEVETVLFPQLCTMAELQHGRAELMLDEETLFGAIVYTADELALEQDSFCSPARWSAMVAKADSVCLSVQEHKLQILLYFRLYTEAQLADYTQQINRLLGGPMRQSYEAYLQKVHTLSALEQAQTP